MSDVLRLQKEAFLAARASMHVTLTAHVSQADVEQVAIDHYLESASAWLEVKELVQSAPLPPWPKIPTRNGIPTRRLTPDEERDLTLLMSLGGSSRARDLLAMSQHRLAKMLARQYSRNTEPLCSDLLQEALLGCLRATETFDPFRGIRFSTYAGQWIRAKTIRFLQNRKRVEMSKVPNSDARLMVGSLSDIIPGTDEETCLEAVIPDPSSDLEAEVFDKIELDRVIEVMRQVAQEDRRYPRLVEKRYMTLDPISLGALGRETGGSHEGARLLEKRFLAKTRQVLGVDA